MNLAWLDSLTTEEGFEVASTPGFIVTLDNKHTLPGLLLQLNKDPLRMWA